MTTAEIPAMPPLTDGGAEQLAWFNRMRAEQPLWQDPNGGYRVFRHADVQSVLADPARFSSNFGRVMPFVDPARAGGNVLWADPPAHRPLRQLVGQAFTARTVAGLRPRITEITRDLITAIPTGEFDFVELLAYPMPVIVIAELLGVSPADREFFRTCADKSLNLRVRKDQSPEESAATVANALKDLDGYLLEQVRHRRGAPTDDLLGTLTTAEVDGSRLTDLEIVSFATVLLNAGYMTTTLLLGNTLLCLRDNPSVAAQLRADRSLIPAALVEVLRRRPPFPSVYRISTEEVSIAGGTIPANAFVAASVLSANHDERIFAQPERFDLHREPNRHLGFGHGIHFCLGAPLALLEVEIAVNLLLDTFADIEVSERVRLDEGEFYGTRRLPVSGRRS
jgi:cytochrome P450